MMRTLRLTLGGLLVAASFVWLAVGDTIADQQGQATSPPAQAVPPLDADVTPLTSKNLVGHRLWLIVFDKSLMQASDAQRALADATQWTSNKTPNVDVVAVAVIGSTGLRVLQDFTSNDAKLRRALASFNDEPLDSGTAQLNADSPALGVVSNDQRLAGLKTLCEALKPWPDRKEMLYFTVGGTSSGGDNPLQYRDAVNACEKAHVTIDSIDARGLTPFGRGGRARGGPTEGPIRATTPPDAPSVAEHPNPLITQLSGTWECDTCTPGLAEDFGQKFTLTAGSTSIAIESATPPVVTWTFYFSGPREAATALWQGTDLVLTKTTHVDSARLGFSGPVIETYVLTVIKDGPNADKLQVQGSSLPSLKQDGVSIYKKTQ